jgi:Reverse transcriptase (RNA-dependent DNA polymerase)
MNSPKSSPEQDVQSVLEMTSSEARTFLLKSESYCNIDFPPYFRFSRVLSKVSRAIGRTDLKTMLKQKPRDCDGVNYPLLTNKDGRHAWRPLQLVHPALYVSLVNYITAKNNWKVIQTRFADFQSLTNFKCLSIPIRSRTTRKDKAAQILHWWQGIEQGAIELALDYAYVLHADITDCYSAIYTHSIAWALHGKPTAKASRTDPNLIGNRIDWHIQDMRHGQTNGIPQGSVLMDLIAEMVLGFADLDLSERLTKKGITEYRVLRYRDDYRIFVNNPQNGEVILKTLTEVMIDLGLKLNTSKTTGSQSVVSSSLKKDKLAWLRARQSDHDIQKHLLVIHAHGVDYPNAGSLVVGLTHFHERLSKIKKLRNPVPLISIAVDIAYSSPRAFPVCAAIISQILWAVKAKKERIRLIEKIHEKLSQLPNTGHMEVWLQRISHPYKSSIAFGEHLCQLVDGSNIQIWNNSWISSKDLLAALDPTDIVDKQKLKSLKPVVKPKEIRVFAYERY